MNYEQFVQTSHLIYDKQNGNARVTHFASPLPERSAYSLWSLPSVARYPNRLQSSEIFLRIAKK